MNLVATLKYRKTLRGSRSRIAVARRNGKEVCRAHFVRTVTFRRLCPLKELSDGQSESSVFRQGSFNSQQVSPSPQSREDASGLACRRASPLARGSCRTLRSRPSRPWMTSRTPATWPAIEPSRAATRLSSGMKAATSRRTRSAVDMRFLVENELEECRAASSKTARIKALERASLGARGRRKVARPCKIYGL